MSTGHLESADAVQPAAGDDLALAAALAAELGRRTSVSWLVHGGRTHPVWHVWSDGALCVVSGGSEQPLPDLPDGAEVEVLMRGKDTGGRIAWVGVVSVVRPDDEAWAATAAALVAGRLNLADPSTAAERWAGSSVVRRFTPRRLSTPVH